MNLAQCTGCQRLQEEAELVPMLSVLDWKRHLLCWRCFDARSEPLVVVVRTAGLRKWNEVPAEIQQSVMVFDGLAGEYVDFECWCRRTAKRQIIPGMAPKRRRPPRRPVPHLKQIAPPQHATAPPLDEEDEALASVLESMRRTAPHDVNVLGSYDDLPPTKRRYRGFWHWLCQQF